jgi:adenine-specific DNA methylase
LAGYEPAESSGAPDPSVTGQPASYEPAESGDDIVPFGYLSPGPWPDDEVIWQRIRALEKETATHPSGPLTVPEEPLPLVDARGAFFVKLYGFEKWGQFFTPRQLLSLLTFAKIVRLAYGEMLRLGYDEGRIKATLTYLGILVDRLADYNTTLCSWHNTREVIGHTYARQALPMVWDFIELKHRATSCASLKSQQPT